MKIDDLEILHEIIDGIKESSRQGREPAFSYERISDKVQKDGLSLQFQEDGAARYAASKRLNIIKCFSIVESAKSKGRKIFNKMLDLAVEHGIKHIIFKNTDRMSRNYYDLIRIQELIDKHDFNIHFYQAYRVLNKQSTYIDDFILDVEVAAAKQLSKKLSYEVKTHNKYKAGKGIAPCISPYGYKYNKKTRMHEIDKTREKDCRFIFDEFDTHKYSLTEFTVLINKRGIRSKTKKLWKKSQLYFMLTNPFYHGEFIYHGEILPGTHKKYYNKDRYEERCKILSGRFIGTKKWETDYLLAKFIKCASCGKTMTGTLKKEKYIYYKHDCPNAPKQVNIIEDEIFALIDGHMRNFAFSAEFGDYLKQLIRESTDYKKDDARLERVRFNRRISALEAKQEKLLDLYADDKIDRGILNKKIEQYRIEIRLLERQRESLSVDTEKFYIKVVEVIDMFRQLPQIYLEAPREGKVEILRSMATAIKLDGEDLEILWEKPYSFFVEPQVLALQKETSGKVPTRPILLPR